MDTVRRSLRITDICVRLRSFRVQMLQPHNCAVAGLNYWMPHDEEASTFDLDQNSKYIDDAWKETNPCLFRECSRVHTPLFTWLYKRVGLCEDEEQVMPWIMAKCPKIFLACYERNVNALWKLILKHDTLFTLACNYDVHANHNIERIPHQHLVNSINTLLQVMD